MGVLVFSQKKRRWRSVLAIVSWCLYCVALLELASRGYWAIKHRVPWFHMSDIVVGRFYPELRSSGALAAPTAADDDCFDVLLLGGSVLTEEFGSIGKALTERLAQKVGQPVRIYNAAACAMTSRDSLIKYKLLDKQRFDLVVFYHAINEARLNNCPREMFRPDYSHCSWYARIERLKSHAEINWSVLPYTLEYLTIGILDQRCFNIYLPKNTPDDGQWYEDGEDVKTTASFEANLREILELAAHRGAEVLLPTYAIHIPTDYNYEKSVAGKLDYALGKGIVEAWGTPTGVAKAVREHNKVTRRLAAEYNHVLFVDLEKSMPRNGQHYNDVCHLTELGCERWVDETVPRASPWLATRANSGTTEVRQASKPVSFR